MPVYKGNNEVTSGNLHKGSTEIQNGYKATDQFYVNTLAITINFIDAISGASMSTTQFQSIGTPGASFSSFTRTITTNSGRIFNGAVTVAEAGDSGNNVTASISGQGSTTATLNVSGTYPSTGVTVTLTVNGATQVQLPNLNVTQNGNYPVTTTSDAVALGTFNYSTSQSVSGGGICSGGTGNTSGTLNSGSSSYTWYSFSKGNPWGGTYGNGCGVTCNSSFSASKSGYNSGSTNYAVTGGNPQWGPGGSTQITVNCSSVGSSPTYTYCPSGSQTSNALTCSGSDCTGSSPVAGTCSGSYNDIPTIDTNNFYFANGSSNFGGATNGGTTSVTWTSYYITPIWTITCPGNGAGMSQAQLIANCSLVQNGTNITIVTAPVVTGASGACNAANPPLICGGGSWSNTNGAPTPTINLGCTRPTCI